MAGALAQATIAGVTAFIVLTILGVPFAAPLALIIFFLDLIPLVGATIGAVLVGVVTLFQDFPTATIIWAIYSIVYQQLENNLIQPQIQKRAVDINPFLVIVSVLFGSALLGITGRAGGDPGRRVDPDRRTRVPGLQGARAAAASREDEQPPPRRPRRRSRRRRRLSAWRRKRPTVAAIPPPITKPATAAPTITACGSRRAAGASR